MAILLKKPKNSCHSNVNEHIEGLKKIVLSGSPNVGKSVVFGNLTGKYVTVSNYPGTTVEVTRGKGKIGDKEFEVIDTPGMYSLLPITEEERVARSILLEESPDVVVQVADAKNIERMLHLTLQLLEAELPVILDLNLMDEAERLGMKIDIKSLQRELGIPIVSTVATENKGMDTLREIILRYKKPSVRTFKYDQSIESAIQRIEEILEDGYGISKREIAILLLQDDAEIKALFEEKMGNGYADVERIIEETKKGYSQPLNYVITLARQGIVSSIVERVTISTISRGMDFRERLSRLMMHPLSGIPILLMAILWTL